ncbi:MAG: DUF1566 domain-containing protein [Nitrosospira sp.]
MNKQFTSRKLLAGLMLAAGFVCAPIAQAALEDLGNGIIKDTDLGLVWLADANNSKTSGYNTNGLMAWNAANNWVEGLTAGGRSDWRLPTTDEMKHLFYSELDGIVDHNIYSTHNNANFGLFENIQATTPPLFVETSTLYWTNTPATDNSKASVFAFWNGHDYAYDKNEGRFAMAVASIPEPETYAMLLAGLSLVGFIARRRKQIP